VLRNTVTGANETMRHEAPSRCAGMDNVAAGNLNYDGLLRLHRRATHDQISHPGPTMAMSLVRVKYLVRIRWRRSS
jgi:hypothetical protein